MRPPPGTRNCHERQGITSHQETLAPSVRPLPEATTPELAEIVKKWPRLTEATRAGILAMVRAAAK
jgi:hypothetical protein